MALIALAVHDTSENQRTKYTIETLKSLAETVDWTKHRLFIIDNGSCQDTKDILNHPLLWRSYTNSEGNKFYRPTIITNETNRGTANAINQAWKFRQPGEHLIKMDNDVVIHSSKWVEEMEQAIARDPGIGQVGLKRKDCGESPSRTDHLRSYLQMLPHKNGEPWIVVEAVQHVMGTCVMHNSALIDKIGGLYQMEGVYGFDDCLMSLRSSIAGFKNVFLPHIHIDHIDVGGDAYCEWKHRYAGEMTGKFNDTQKKMLSGEISIKFEL